jgi:hypothetical protein
VAGTGNGPYLDSVREAFRYEVSLPITAKIAPNRGLESTRKVSRKSPDIGC